MNIRNFLNSSAYKRRWTSFWMRYAGLNPLGRVATRFATWFAPPHKERGLLARMNKRGYIEPTATIYHKNFYLGANCFIGDRVIIFQREDGGAIEFGDQVYIYRDTIIETGVGGSLAIGSKSSIHPRCQLNANLEPISIGSGVMIAPNCSLYSYDHGTAADTPIRAQPLKSKGPIIIGDEAWLSVGVIVLSGVRIGKGAIIGAGSVVTKDVPEGAIASGNPASVIRMRA